MRPPLQLLLITTLTVATGWLNSVQSVTTTSGADSQLELAISAPGPKALGKFAKVSWQSPIALVKFAKAPGQSAKALVKPPASSPPHAYRDYPEQLPGPYTGGFGEQTCHSCHFDYDLNLPDGSLEAELPQETYEPGKSYPISIRLDREDIGKGGFQMTARFEDGSQAGAFEPVDDRVSFTSVAANESLQYVQHSESGTSPLTPGEIEWSLIWTAPEEATGPILFHMAANAANGDVSEFGDWIYTLETRITP